MLFTDVIRRKRDGGELGDEEIALFVRGLADGSLPAEQVSSLAMAIFLNGMTFEEAGKLTIAMAGSGKQLWSVVHVEDLARLYRIVLENGGKGIYHGVEYEPIVAGTLASALLKPHTPSTPMGWRPWSIVEARSSIGWLADGLALDQLVATRRCGELPWHPKRSLTKALRSNLIPICEGTS